MTDLTVEADEQLIQEETLETKYREKLYDLVDGNVEPSKESLQRYVEAARNWAKCSLELIKTDKGKELYHQLTDGRLYNQELGLNQDPDNTYPATLLEHAMALNKIINPPANSADQQIITEKELTDALSPFEKLNSIVTEKKLDEKGERNRPYPSHLTHSASIGRHNEPSPYWQKRLEGTTNLIKLVSDLAPKIPQPQNNATPPKLP